jgi:hypothetical protein
LEASGPAAPRLYDLEATGGTCGGADLIEAARDLSQVSDGYFEAYDPPDARAWLTVRAVDGWEWGAECRDEAVLKGLRAAFRRAVDDPQ